ncbi:MAG: glycosyltransferase family 4 protein [Deltaproteobacteria bacterium]|nr:glycosyltransferase family 4 protein [Deltaproteobacteria bacterium]
MKILFIVPYPLRSAAGQRFRFEQFLPSLDMKGIKYFISPFMTRAFYKIAFQRGHILTKLFYTFCAYVRRFQDFIKYWDVDIIYIYREAQPFRFIFFEWMWKKIFKKKILFDFDDAIYQLDPILRHQWLLNLIKKPSKVLKICSFSDIPIVGNRYLYEKIYPLNQNTRILQTVLDTDVFKPQLRKKKHGDPVCIGWSGSPTTTRHLKLLTFAFRKLKEKYGSSLHIKLIGDSSYQMNGIDIESISWNLDDELIELSNIDIGIMPLVNDDWSRGKCGFKALLYMSLGVPAVCSPVGVNSDIVVHGKNGYLAHTESDWFIYLEQLVCNELKRHRMGEEGRKTVVENYSIEKHTSTFLAIVESGSPTL